MTILFLRHLVKQHCPSYLLVVIMLFSSSVFSQDESVQTAADNVDPKQTQDIKTDLERPESDKNVQGVKAQSVNVVEKKEAEKDEISDSQAVPEEQISLSVEALKKQVIKLNRDLFILEEDLLFPANTQLVVYLSLSAGKFINLDSVTLKVDDEIVAAHLYTKRQLKALERGGMQRLYMGNLKTGDHEITAVLHGIGPNNKDYKLAASTAFNKDSELKALEIRIEDQSSTYQPKVSVVEWDN